MPNVAHSATRAADGSHERLTDQEFETLLMAHGAPIPLTGRSALRTFADAPTAGAPPA